MIHWIRRGIGIAVPVLCLLVLAGLFWFPRPTPPQPEPPAELTLWCGPSLRAPAAEIAEGFFRRYGIRVRIESMAPPQELLVLEPARSGDVWIIEDAVVSEQAQRRDRVEEPRVVARRDLVIQVPRGNPAGVQTIADLAQPDRRLFVAGGAAGAVGRLLPALLAGSSLSMADLEPRRIAFDDPRADLDPGRAVAFGRAHAALLWRPNAMVHGMTSAIVPIADDAARNVPVFAAVSKDSPRIEDARQLVRFLAGAGAAEIFRRHHYE